MNHFMVIWSIIEVAVALCLLLTYLNIWRQTEVRKLTEVAQKELSVSTMNNAVSGGLVAVSILLPISLAVALELLEEESAKGALVQMKFAVLYFTTSLTAAAWNLFRLPTLVQKDIDIAY